MLAITRTFPPHISQVSISIPKTRFSRWAQLIVRCRSAGVTSARHRLWGANTPWYLVKCARGLGTRAAKRAMKSSGSKTTWLVPSR